MSKYFDYVVTYHANGLSNDVWCHDFKDAQKKAKMAMALGYFVLVQAKTIKTWQAEEFIQLTTEEKEE